MARKPRSNRPRVANTTSGATQVLDQPVEQNGAAPASAAATSRPRLRPAQAAGPTRVTDYSYVAHDVIRIAIITVLIIGAMMTLSMTMR